MGGGGTGHTTADPIPHPHLHKPQRWRTLVSRYRVIHPPPTHRAAATRPPTRRPIPPSTGGHRNVLCECVVMCCVSAWAGRGCGAWEDRGGDGCWGRVRTDGDGRGMIGGHGWEREEGDGRGKGEAGRQGSLIRPTQPRIYSAARTGGGTRGAAGSTATCDTRKGE